MARYDDDEDAVKRLVLAVHDGILARYAECKLGLAKILTPEEPAAPEDRPGQCIQCGARAIELAADCTVVELAAEHLPTDGPRRVPEHDADKPVHFACWDAYALTLPADITPA